MQLSFNRVLLISIAGIFMLLCPGEILAQDSDSCTIRPVTTASIEGVQARGMIETSELAKFRKLIPDEKGFKITRFTYSIDCDNCEIIVKEVFSDSFTSDDLKLLAEVKSRQVISFECILGTNAKGELIAFKPFLFYVR